MSKVSVTKITYIIENYVNMTIFQYSTFSICGRLKLPEMIK